MSNIAIGEFSVKELIKNHIDSIIEIKVDSKEELNKYKNYQGLNIAIDNKYFKKEIKKEDIHSIAIFNPYKSKQLDNKSVHVILIDPSDCGEIGTIIRTMVALDIFNLVIISNNNDFDIFNKQIVRASTGTIFMINFKIYKSLDNYYKEFNSNIYKSITFKDEKFLSLKVARELYKFIK